MCSGFILTAWVGSSAAASTPKLGATCTRQDSRKGPSMRPIWPQMSDRVMAGFWSDTYSVASPNWPCRSISSTFLSASVGQRVAEIGGQKGGAAAALAGDEGQHLAVAHGWTTPAAAGDAVHRLVEGVVHQRQLQHFAHAGAHGADQQVLLLRRAVSSMKLAAGYCLHRRSSRSASAARRRWRR